MHKGWSILWRFNLNLIKRPPILTQIKWYSTSSEEEIKQIIRAKFPNAKDIAVEDISGGCGAMYTIYIESVDFKGMSIVKQHQAVTNALKEQIKTFHGIRIDTRIPKDIPNRGKVVFGQYIGGLPQKGLD